jgi:hypothetical protein
MRLNVLCTVNDPREDVEALVGPGYVVNHWGNGWANVTEKAGTPTEALIEWMQE